MFMFGRVQYGLGSLSAMRSVPVAGLNIVDPLRVDQEIAKIGGEAPYSGTAQKQLVPLRVRGLRPTKRPIGSNCPDHLFSGPRFRTQKSYSLSLRVRGLGRTTATPGKVAIHHFPM